MSTKGIEFDQRVIEQTIRHEGTKRDRSGKHIAYRCTAGALTIGYGHNLDANPVDGWGEYTKLTEQQALDLLRSDLARFARLLDEAPQTRGWWREIGAPRSAVILDMAFNMGIRGVCTFRRTLRAMRESRWKDARDGMLASKWAGQVKWRAVQMATQMLRGQWWPDIEKERDAARD